MLYVNDSGSGTPFEEGLNTIVIPTSLFTETIFNARVQNETLSETPIYSDDDEIFKFISVGRDGNTVQACEEIDFIIIRFDISSEDAMEVLNLLLECLVNETTNETAIVYSYVSTKENSTAAVMMNLPFSVLGLIPWYCDFENSAMGSKPETFEDWFWKPLKTIGNAIVGFFITIGMGFAELVMLIIDLVVKILMDILPIFAYILWLIIRVALLIFMFIIFAFMLFFVSILMIINLTIVPLITQLINATVSFKGNSIILVIEEYEFVSEIIITWEYKQSFDMKVPAIIMKTREGNNVYLEIKIASFYQSWAGDIIEIITHFIKVELKKYAPEIGVIGTIMYISNILLLLGVWGATACFLIFFALYFSTFTYIIAVENDLLTTHLLAVLLGFIISILASLTTGTLISFINPHSVGISRALFIGELALVACLFIPLFIIWLIFGETN
ncbi:hypothetical protein ES705_07082 [subsurface metagenome]